MHFFYCLLEYCLEVLVHLLTVGFNFSRVNTSSDIQNIDKDTDVQNFQQINGSFLTISGLFSTISGLFSTISGLFLTITLTPLRGSDSISNLIKFLFTPFSGPTPKKIQEGP